MRSIGELAFRLRQEVVNARLLAAPPILDPRIAGSVVGPLAGLPDPALVASELRGSDYAASTVRLAEEIAAHRFQLLGLPPTDLGTRIAWRRDFVHNKETGTEYFRRIPYLDFHRAGDHKIVWELNRHQHLVVLAQAYLLTGNSQFLDEIPLQCESWMEANPFQRGINWCSALEVAFRALSWIWVLHMVGGRLEKTLRQRWMISLYQHGLHIENNLSLYFSPNTHLLGEAVVLHALGVLLPALPRSARWRELGSGIVLEQMRRQVREDGSHFEQSAYYHLYALDFFLLHSLIAQDVPAWYRGQLGRMAEFLDALMSDDGILPMLGDDDGGRVFHPYGDRRRFGQATLTTCALALGRPEWLRESTCAAEQAAWWLGRTPPPPVPREPPESRWFADAGLAVLRSETVHAIVDVGPFGAGTGGHSHADTLSLVVFHRGAEALIDPGTGGYSDSAVRERFRTAAAHNTVSIQSSAMQGVEQASPQGPFRWSDMPEVKLLHQDSNKMGDIIDGVCRYRGFTHRRTVALRKSGTLVVIDRVDGPPGDWCVEQRWLSAEAFSAEGLSCHPPAFEEPAERSCAYGSSIPARRWVARRSGPLPAVLAAVLDFEGLAIIRNVSRDGDSVLIEYEGGTARVPDHGPPEVF